MTLQNLSDGLKSVCSDTYELVAPAGITRAIVWHSYGATTLHGDDIVADQCPKVQIDVYWESSTDTLLRDVETFLTQSGQSYNVVDIYYDDEYALRRCILQLELV